MTQNLIAKASTTVNAPSARVWKALTDQAALKQFMFGSTVVSDWKKGSPITWSGEWKGKPYQDKGRILRIEPERVLQYSHYSPLAGQPDKPENYHTVTVELGEAGDQTRVSLSQDKNSTEEARAHSQKNWETMLKGLKQYVEQ